MHILYLPITPHESLIMNRPITGYLISMGVSMVISVSTLFAEESNSPKPIPRSRDEMKQALENLKTRSPRLPLPEPTAEERSSGDQRQLVNNGRMRRLYLDDAFTKGAFSREKDPHMTLDYAFTVEFFWIASRVNNCHYCLGHQENKLLAAGRSENRIAALDSDWSFFTTAEHAAFAFARKLSLEPHLIQAEDLELLGKYYEPRQILEICYHVAGYNAMNRWTDSMGIPQEEHRSFLTATPTNFAGQSSVVAPDELPDRGNLESRSEVEKRLIECRIRKPLLPLVEESEARQILGLNSDEAVPPWQRLLLQFPITGRAKVESLVAVRDKGRLPELLKAKLDWVTARHDRAWYDLSNARHRLQRSGLSDDQIFELDRPESQESAAVNAALRLAIRITVAPQTICDSDLDAVSEHFSAHETAEIVHYITQTAFLHRVTEPARLPADL